MDQNNDRILEQEQNILRARIVVRNGKKIRYLAKFRARLNTGSSFKRTSLDVKPNVKVLWLSEHNPFIAGDCCSQTFPFYFLRTHILAV